MQIPNRTLRLEEYHVTLAAALADSNSPIYIDTCVLMWLIKIGAEARHEFLSWCRTALPNQVFIPTWTAHELYHHLQELTIQNEASRKNSQYRTNLANILEDISVAADTVVSRSTRHSGPQDLVNKARQNIIEIDNVLTGIGRCTDRYEQAVTEIIDFVNERSLDSKLFDLLKPISDTHAIRFGSRIPPGFKDAHKPDNSIGDLVFWQEIIADLQSRSNPPAYAVIITTDDKPDWSWKGASIENYEGKLIKSGSQQGGLAQLLQKHVTSAVKQTKNQAAHFMRVTLQDLSQAPREFKDLEEVRDYLTETSPVSFDPSWAAEKEIRAKAASAGLPIEAVSIYLGHSKNTATPIYKAYGEAHQVRGGSVTIQKIKYFQGVGSDWWAWVGLPDRPALISNDKVSGIRIRARNIQVGRASIFDELFKEVSPSNDRFNKYYVGEVHIGGDKLIPNARRDGFEDNADWVAARKELRDFICEPLSEIARELSNSRQKSIALLGKAVTALEKKVGVGKTITNEAKLEILHTAGQIRKRIANAVSDADADTRIKLTAFADSIELVKQRLGVYPADQKAALRTEILKEFVESALTIVEPYLEPPEFSRVRRSLRALK